MRLSRPLATLSALAMAITVATGSTLTAGAEPGGAPVARSAEDPRGRGVEARRDAVAGRLADAVRASAATAAGPLPMPTSYPFQPRLRFYPDNRPDATDSSGVISHDEIAPLLTRWMRRSDRISTHVVGQSTQRRDLYLVTVTAPETPAQTRQQAQWRRQIKERPVSAAADQALRAGYKVPVWFSANIHGNEWEGTDASLEVIERLLEAPYREVRGLLQGHRLYFSLTLNPDGRTLGTRATFLGLNENRDMITNTTPEAVSYVRTAAALQAVSANDLHGYTEVLQIEPCGPPHGENYEYDLFVPHAYALARQVERDVVAARIPGNTYYNVRTGKVVDEVTGPASAHVRIPYRDIPSGWDDYPPIFTAQYAAFFGAITSTVELPIDRTGDTTQSPGNARINIAVGTQTIESTVDYVAGHGGALLDNQIEMFRRGVAGEPKDALTVADVDTVPGPRQWRRLWDVVDNQDPVRLPRVYLIPRGDRQRSQSDADAVVAQLLLHGIEVGVLRRARTIGGVTYPAGSYVVDMHQPLRGLANSLLDLGTDISDKVPEMYDISAWSLSYLWGATVDKVGAVTDAAVGPTDPITAPVSDAALPTRGRHLSFPLAGVADFQALNALLERGVRVSSLADGSVVVGPRAYGAVRAVSRRYDIDVDAATRRQLDALDAPATRGLSDLTLAYTGTQDDTLSLTELGFDDLVAVNRRTLAEDPSVLDGVDVLWVAASLAFTRRQQAGLRTVQAFVDAGGSIVGTGRDALRAAREFGLVDARAVVGNELGNGIVAVDTPRGSVLAAHAQEASFGYPATSFRAVRAGTTVEQSYVDGDVLLAGHWPTTTRTDGPAYAAGRASAISGQSASGAKGFVFGTSVMFRNHMKGGMSQAARALFWAGPEGAGVPARRVPSTR